MNSQASQSVEIQKEFPDGPCIKGKVYVMDAPWQQRIITMSEESWGEFGTRQETMRNLLAAQDKRIKELLAESAVQTRMHADTMSRLEALRTVRRAEKRPEIEADMNLPNQKD